MNFQQLRSVREAARCGYNLTEVSNVLFTSQPGVSRQIRDLEDELGVDIFERNGKRLTGLTDPGKGILKIIERLLLEAKNLQHAGIATDIVLTAMDSDVIKQYVALGLGVGIVTSMAFNHGRDTALRAMEASHLFAQNVTRLAVRRGAYLRSYAYNFIQQFAPGSVRRATALPARRLQGW